VLPTVLLQGCTLSHTQIRHADALIAQTTPSQLDCTRTDHCAEPSPLLQAADAALAASTTARPQHVVTLLDDSEAAIVARINLIRAARRSIDVQTYIWDQDDIGKLVLDELIRAAQRGVQVRILADQLFSFSDPVLLDRLARAHTNFQIKLYNPTFHNAHTPPLEFAAGIVCCFMRFNQRMHNKVMVIDDAIGITGGRNYQNRYFDWDPDFDYVDRDVMVGGPAAQAMAASFDLFWQHKRSVALTHLRDVNRQIRRDRQPPSPWQAQYDQPARVAQVQQEAQDPDWLQSQLLDASLLTTGQVDFYSDMPAKTEDPSKRNALEFTHHLMRMVAGAKSEVLLQTPYLVMSRRAQKIFEQLRQGTPPPRIVVSTNSLASTDAFAVYALSYKHRKRYLKNYGFEIYEFKPRAVSAVAANARSSLEWIDQPSVDEQSEASRDTPVGDRASDPRLTTNPTSPSVAATAAGGSGSSTATHLPGTERHSLLGSKGNRPAPLTSTGRRFGLHAKSIVVDDYFAMVGSHNFDPRSDHYNTEAGVIIYDPRFATRLRQSILRDTQPENAWVIAPRHAAVPLLTDINEMIGDVSEKLPIFDLWPFRYATSYQLKPGCGPLRPDDPAFFGCYQPVGDFPEVALSPKLIYTRLITAFGAGVKGIL
jgi:phosphatidylserine/phosphatidylglycerophosphate/cardiolipin synthase-like enzyme